MHVFHTFFKFVLINGTSILFYHNSLEFFPAVKKLAVVYFASPVSKHNLIQYNLILLVTEALQLFQSI